MRDAFDTLDVQQGRDKRALAFAVMPLSTAGMALWIGIVAARGGNPMHGFGNVGAADIVVMIGVGFLCRIVAARRVQPAPPPLGLQIVLGLIIVLAVSSLAACALAAENGCGGHGCGDTVGFLVVTGIIFGLFAIAASVFTIRFMRQPMLPK